MGTEYEIFCMSHQAAGGYSIQCLTPLKNMVDPVNGFDAFYYKGKKNGVDLEIPTSFEDKGDAIVWYGKYQYKVKKFIEEYNANQKGIGKKRLVYNLPKKVYFIETATYKN